jgi:hypothetical protein
MAFSSIWIVSQPAGVFVAVLGVKYRQVQLALDQIMHRRFKGARLKLFLVVDHDHGALVVFVVLEAGNAAFQLTRFLRLIKTKR